MNRTNKKEFLQNVAGFFVGILIYNLIFHREDDLLETLIRTAIVAVIAATITTLVYSRSK
jgi:hypothetical protein